MKNNPIYKQMEQIALDEDYTVEQAELATDAQIKTLLDAPGLKPAFIANMRRCIFRVLASRDDERDLQQLKSQILNWLSKNFPDFEMERGREDDKPFVKIWLKGKPEVSE